MDAGSIPPEIILGRRGQQMKPKPVSLQHRFVLMQAGSVALTLLLVAAALYLGKGVRSRLVASLDHLEATMSLQSRVHESLGQTVYYFWRAYSSIGEQSPLQYQQRSRELRELTGRYSAIPLSDNEQRQIEILGEREGRLLERMDWILMRKKEVPGDAPELREVEDLTRQIETSLRQLTDQQTDQVRTASERLDLYTRGLFVALVTCPLFAVGALEWFRYVHRRHVWKPLNEIRRMLLDVRRGDLNVTAEVPPNLEFGIVVSAFLDMAAELREMRSSLEQKVMERTAKWEAAQKELVQAAKLTSLGQLVSGVAHEINNPLTSILGFSEVLLSRSDLSARLRSQIQTIREESVRLKNLVANLSSFAQQGPHCMQRVDLREMIDRLIESRGEQLAASNIVIHDQRPSKPVWVLGDPDQLFQAFLNLELNAEQAIQACRQEGAIWLDGGVEGDDAWVSLKDNGTGMAADVRDHIFDPFYTIRADGQGTGLGMSISHGIIRQHRGEIKVESASGEGTTIRVFLPQAPSESSTAARLAEPAASNEEARALPSPAPASPHVLVIDDEPSIGEFLETTLAQRGCRVTLLNGSARLESTLENSSFDLVICDLKMPGRNGIEVLRVLRRLRPELARHFLLMSGNLADAEAGRPELENVTILPKPFTSRRLMEAVETVIDASG